METNEIKGVNKHKTFSCFITIWNLSTLYSCEDEASKEKERLEEKQRAARKERAKRDEEWSTRWETHTDTCIHFNKFFCGNLYNSFKIYQK